MFSFLMHPTTILALFIIAGVVVGVFIVKNVNKGKAKLAKNTDPEPESANPEPSINTTEIGTMAPEKTGMVCSVANNSLVVANNERGYLTNVFRVRSGRTELIEMKFREPLGTGLDREPAVPFHGRYIANEIVDPTTKEVTYKYYDPREEPVISKNTPWDCYDATHCEDKVDAVYANKNEWGDKVNLIVIGIAIVCNFIVALVALGKIGG
jgi:hypothetical protein